ncbi:restriction endonuclease subunit S [Photobacterium phosphoreum]|uniref:restriction endonuclease subunit S n=1 Tax=Photobacterium phosphoreum TaxID=659 RepID=UPI001E6244E2|nr:restriction endonuclease subunit S [Photobacterium phosphoreum]MCD9485510.1 restriction endonuclease subunit S [Photobacterium phosphoreum]
MVPNGWENKTLESLCEPTAPITYGVLKPGNYVNGGTPLLQIKDLLNDLSEIDSLHRISPELDLEYKRSRIATNDILISLVGTVGRIGLVPKELNGANIHRNLGRIRTKNYEFLVHYLNSDIAKNKIGLSSSGSSQSALNLSVLKALKVSIPPLPEQRKIAQILSTWDRGIATTEKLIDASKQQKKALMQQLLTGKKRLVDPETGKAFEGDWEEVKLSDVASIKRGAGSQYITYVENPNNGIRLIRISDFLGDSLKYIEKTKDINRFTLKKGDLLIAGTGATAGIVFKVPDNLEGFAFSYNAPRIRTQTSTCKTYIYYYLKSSYILQQQMALFTGNAQPFLDTKAIGGFKIKLPNIEEQQKIASVLTAADKDIELLKAKLAHFKQEKKALMQQLLTGKRRVSLSS